jgi:hypothetical protein
MGARERLASMCAKLRALLSKEVSVPDLEA